MLDEEDRDREKTETLAAALRAPGRPDELAGLEPALAAFRSAWDDPARNPDSGGEHDPSRAVRHGLAPRWRRPVLTAAVSASLLFAAAATVAETGALPDPVQRMAHTVLGGIGVPPHGHRHRDDGSTLTAGGTGGSAARSGRPTGTTPLSTSPAASLPNPPPSPGSATTSLSDLDLCVVILVDQKGLHSKVIDPAARDRLTAAAGGEERIIAYCEALLTTNGIDYPPPSPAASEHHPSPAPPRSRSSSR